MPTPTRSYFKDKDGTTYAFISLRGAISLKGQMVENVSRPGVDGDAWRKTGKRGQSFDMLGVRDFSTYSDSDTFQSAVNELRGTILDLFDDFATEYHCMLLDVVREKQGAVLKKVGGLAGSPGDAGALATFRFTLWHQPPDS